MVQSDVLRGTTQSGKVNARWYLQRLKASAANRHDHDTIRVVRGTTATQGRHIPRVYLNSPTRSFETQQIRKKSCDNHHHLASATSLKSASTANQISPSLSEFNSNSYQSLKTIVPKDDSSERRSSLGTQTDLIARPPSTPVDPRCDRAYSSTINPVQRETCSLLGPKLCSDCIETQTRSNLSAERLPANLMRQRLSALAIRRFILNEQYLNDDDLLRMVNNQQIQMTNKSSNEVNSTVISDDEYFDRLSLSLNQNAGETPFYFKDFKDFARKYRSNKYPRLLLSETPAPKSANPIFRESSFEKFDVSSKYSYMKRASMIKPNFKSNASIFISPRKSEQFLKEHRYLTNYSPPLLLQTLQKTVRNHSNPHFLTPSHEHSLQKTRTLINSKSSQKANIDL